MYIDTHAHFDLCLENRDITEEELLSEMENSSTAFAVQISIDVKGLRWSYDFALKHRDRGIRFSLGIHPSSRATEVDLETLAAVTEEVMVAGDTGLLFGIGETGLDYYRMHQPVHMQQHSFEYQIGLAKRHGLPVIIHSREAMDDTISILKRLKPEKGIMHCFPGDSAAAAKILDLGMYISFAGNLTYKNAHELHDAARYVPLDRILLETDAPFLTPVPFRGKKNRPHYVSHTYKFLAELRGETLSSIEDAVHRNFLAVCGAK